MSDMSIDEREERKNSGIEFDLRKSLGVDGRRNKERRNESGVESSLRYSILLVKYSVRTSSFDLQPACQLSLSLSLSSLLLLVFFSKLLRLPVCVCVLILIHRLFFPLS